MRRAPDAVILCGGEGLRLRALTSGPKPMISVAGRPFLELLFQQLRRHGIRRVILATGYKGSEIQSYFGNEASGLQLLYSPEPFALGTAGALRLASRSIESNTALILNGDSYTDADLQQFMKHHEESSADLSVLVVPSDGRTDCGSVATGTSNSLSAFDEKRNPLGSKKMNAGIYAISRELLLEIPPDRKVSLEEEMIPRWIAAGRKVRAFADDAKCVDIGTPDRYATAQIILADAETKLPACHSEVK